MPSNETPSKNSSALFTVLSQSSEMFSPPILNDSASLLSLLPPHFSHFRARIKDS